MLSGLPTLLGKNFIISYLLPATLFVLLLSAVLAAFDISVPPIITPRADGLADLIKLVDSSFIIILVSIGLLAVNQPLDWLLQGYDNPIMALGAGYAKRKFTRDIEPVIAEKKRIDDLKKTSDDPVVPQLPDFVDRMYEAARDYPDDAAWVLPTRFGNVSRAAEIYPRVVYGLDGAASWRHLLMIVPKEVDERLKDSRSIVDFLMNVFALSLVLACVYCVLAAYNCSLEAPWIPVILLITAPLTWRLMPAAAREWGYTVKAVYDLYRGKLAKELGFRLPPTAEAEFAFWQNVSRAMIYRSHDHLRRNNAWRTDKAASSGEKDK